MSGQETGGLRERLEGAIGRAVVIDPTVRGYTSAALDEVQPELDAKDATIERLTSELAHDKDRIEKLLAELREKTAEVDDKSDVGRAVAEGWLTEAGEAGAKHIVEQAAETQRLQAELDAKDAQIAEQRAENEHAKAIAASLLDMQAAENYLKVLARAEDAEGERDRLKAERAGWRSMAGVDEVEAERDRLRAALTAIGTRCETSTGPSTCHDDPNRSPDGTDMMSRWCDGCIARAALDQSDTSTPQQAADDTHAAGTGRNQTP